MRKHVIRSFLGILMFASLTGAVAQTVPVGKFLVLNGVDQHMVIPNHSDFNILAGESYTISFRIEPDNFAAQYSILSKGNQMEMGGKYELFTLYTVSAPNLGINLRNNDNTHMGASYVTSINEKTWVHVAWVYNSADRTSRIYVDGSLVNTVSHNQIGKKEVSNTCDVLIGCALTDAVNPFKFQFWKGYIDELRIWKRALSEFELSADRNTANPLRNDLVAFYDFENIVNNTAKDISGNKHDAILIGFGPRVVKPQLPVAIGDKNERLTGFRIYCETEHEKIQQVTLDLKGTDYIDDLKEIRIYLNGDKERLNLSSARLFGSLIPSERKVTVRGDLEMIPGENYFWITADISPIALEGHRVEASVVSVSTSLETITSLPVVKGSRTILLDQHLLFSGGSGGSSNYRIPAIVTAADGSLVTATDRRWNSAHDLPSDIDLVIRRSADLGHSWSEPLTLAGEGTETGYGDAALVLNKKNREVICLFNGDRGFFESTPTNPIRIYVSRSRDNGITWSPPADITSQIYGAECSNPATTNWKGAFVSSGSAMQLRNGRIMAVMPVRERWSRDISNFILYSDDCGYRWKVSANRITSKGSEAKLVEQDGGVVLASIRNQGSRIFNLSKDYGATWGTPFLQTALLDPACNGDMIRYTAICDGFQKNRILHSIPWSDSRKNVSVLLSYDEGETWPVKRTIYPDASAYSSLCILSDGTIGMYYEAGEYEIYQMYFVRFSLDWLSGGTDSFRRRLNQSSSVAGPGQDLSAWTLYPNPASDEAHISGSFEPGTLIRVFNLKGEILDQIRLENFTSSLSVDVRHYPAGTYLVRIGEVTSKLIINR